MRDRLKYLVSRVFEVMLLRLCVKILRGRNVQRALVISRSDNNQLWGYSEVIEVIANNIEKEYQ